MAEEFKSLPPTPEAQIEARLANAMDHLKREMASQDVDVDAIGCVYMVAWEHGEVSVTRADIIPPYDDAPKPTRKTKASDNAPTE